jgi:phage gpG-like protein
MIAIELDGDVSIIRGLDSAIKAVGSPKPLLNDIGNTIINEVNANFSNEGTRLNLKRWTPLTAATIRDRIRKGFSPIPILQRTGKLRRSFFSRVGRDSVTVGSSSKYYPTHQMGTEAVPKRTMLKFSPNLKRGIMMQFTRFIHNALNGGRKG